jgi:hypothetical protein
MRMAGCVLVALLGVVAAPLGGAQATVPFTTIAAGTMSRIAAPRDVVVRSTPEWQALWSAHAGDDSPAPAVDFSTEIVVGIFAGGQPTAGITLAISSVTRSSDSISLVYEIRRPPPDAISAQVLTYPFQIVRIPAAPSTPVSLTRRTN